MVAGAERQLRAAVAVELRRGGTELGHAAEQEKTRCRGNAADTVEGAGRIEERRRTGIVTIDVEGTFAFDVHATATGGRHPLRRDIGEFDRRATEREGGDERQRRIAGEPVGNRSEREDLVVEHKRALAAGVGEKRGPHETSRCYGRGGFTLELHRDTTRRMDREFRPIE